MSQHPVISEPIFAEYQDHMGDDLAVANAARASFGKESEWVFTADGLDWSLKDTDARLIRFLASGYTSGEWEDLLDEIITVCSTPMLGYRERRDELAAMLKAHKRRAQHWAPFAHCHLKLRMRLPVFLARQMVKHQVGATWSEESRRYVDDSPTFWFPDEWHTRPGNVKQGSGSALGDYEQTLTNVESLESTQQALDTYHRLLQRGVAPEEARIHLPLNMMTTVVWTGSLLFWARVHWQRADSHAQLAAQELARQISEIVKPHFPVAWDALTN